MLRRRSHVANDVDIELSREATCRIHGCVDTIEHDSTTVSATVSGSIGVAAAARKESVVFAPLRESV
jgi:hypothetical protein